MKKYSGLLVTILCFIALICHIPYMLVNNYSTKEVLYGIIMELTFLVIGIKEYRALKNK